MNINTVTNYQTPVFYTAKQNTDKNDNVLYTQSAVETQSGSTGTNAPNTSLRWYDFDGTGISAEKINAVKSGSLMVVLGKNEFTELTEEIEKALGNGENWINAVQKMYNKQNHMRGQNVYDEIYINPYTGGITYASPARGSWGSGEGTFKFFHSKQDDDAVWDLAYDLQEFLKLRVFGETNGMSSRELESEIADIKARQGGKDTSRHYKDEPIMTGVVMVPLHFGGYARLDLDEEAKRYKAEAAQKVKYQNGVYDEWERMTAGS